MIWYLPVDVICRRKAVVCRYVPGSHVVWLGTWAESSHVKAASASFNKAAGFVWENWREALTTFKPYLLLWFKKKKDSSSFTNDELCALKKKKSRVSNATREGAEESPELGNKHGPVFICVSLSAAAPRGREPNPGRCSQWKRAQHSSSPGFNLLSNSKSPRSKGRITQSSPSCAFSVEAGKG